MVSNEIEIEDLGDYEMDPETSAKVEKMTAEADAEIEAARVNFRWGKEQLDVVKRAARIMGVPYQTLIKLLVYQQSLLILKDVAIVKKANQAA
jgi:predicted DNA binding CopG/RHH family protein